LLRAEFHYANQLEKLQDLQGWMILCGESVVVSKRTIRVLRAVT